ncbi:P-loop containing nucleoside triphosphate hydrolase protein [Elaphomyces granulatus]
MPIEQQIHALEKAGHIRVHGDQPGHHGEGYSLHRTILAHGTELDPRSEHYFELDIYKMSSVPEVEKRKRLGHILQKFPLDKTQRAAFNKSTSAICAGVHLIQGPPGTGKTRTALVIILALASLNLRVLLAAGSNKGVDNLAIAVANAIQSDSFLRNWCGQLVRFQTRTRQMAVLRANSASTRFPGRATSEVRGPQAVLEFHQMHHLVKQHAESNFHEDKDCREYLDLLRRDSERGLNVETNKMLQTRHDRISRQVLSESKIVANTLSNSAQEMLHHPGAFDPDFLVCDEAGQCLEGDHMIAMTMPSIKAVILIGDQEQLPPTVVTEHSNNEGADYLKRSLMERLCSAGYPTTMLSINYRNHPAILDLFNHHVYAGRLTAAPGTSSPDRVGNAWDAFTRSHHHFYNFDLEGVRRLFISVVGKARHEGNSQSWSNGMQVHVTRHLLTALYAFRSPTGDRVLPEDVMIISPYKDQVKLVNKVFSEHKVGYRDNLTVDASHGQEAKLVIFLMTKPSDDGGQRTGFLVDRQRMNVALSRAQQVEVIIGNLEIWNPASLTRLAKWTKNMFLVKLLRDVTAKGHTLTWADIRTGQELEKPVGFPGYISHDNRQPKDKRHPRQEVPCEEDPWSINLDYVDLNSRQVSPRSPQSLTPRAESRLQPESGQPKEWYIDLQPTELSESFWESGPSGVALTQPDRTAVEEERAARKNLKLARLETARQLLEVRQLEEEYAAAELDEILSNNKRDQHIAQMEESERASKRRYFLISRLLSAKGFSSVIVNVSLTQAFSKHNPQGLSSNVYELDSFLFPFSFFFPPLRVDIIPILMDGLSNEYDIR